MVGIFSGLNLISGDEPIADLTVFLLLSKVSIVMAFSRKVVVNDPPMAGILLKLG